MKIIKNIKQKVGSSVLHKKAETLRRKKILSCFEDARSVGILFNVTEQNYDIIYEFVSYLKTLEIDISALGYFNGKMLPNNYILRKHFSYFLKTDLNWYGKPTLPLVENFIHSEFDILINLDTKRIYPLQYIAGLCKAKFKIGKHTENENFCDLTIEMGNNTDINYLLEQIKHYLPQLAQKVPVALH